LPADKVAAISDRARNGGAEIVQLLKTGSAYYAPSSSAVAMVEAILLDSKRILPSCVYATGQYGVKNLYCGLPAALGANGVDRIVELELGSDDMKMLQVSAHAVQELVAQLA
jgi:malate dehydrogenase